MPKHRSPSVRPFGKLAPMMRQKSTFIWVGLVALLVVIVALFLGNRLLNGDGSLLRNVQVDKGEISPNADGDTDATTIAYELSRNATVSIYFENEAGDRFYFRREKPRGAGEYRVTFSGVVDPYTLPDDQIEGEILARLLQDGRYTWTVIATDENDVTETQQGELRIADADSVLPDIRDFALDKDTFTPNRDGIDDRVQPVFYLIKDVAEVRVFLQMPDGREVHISEFEQIIEPNAEGWHKYDYEGGVDEGATPPTDGTYPLVVVAQDLEGQQVRVQDELTIEFGGVPRVRVVSPPAGETVAWETTAVPVCGIFNFSVTVENYGTTPIRTSGPPPGVMYDSDWNYNTLGWFTQPGVFRLGIGFENELTNYPFRWALGSEEDLELIDGFYYLMPGQRATITGSIRMVDDFGDRNPQTVWAGLIHEDVQVVTFYERVDPQALTVDLPNETNQPECSPRDVPEWPLE
ncbi:hypothetical protein [Candidatus Leptofilum sp.]|uniref:hypothetical protein n=1 Tax=Candidatus Leptofilum sp. TaxID=3241576 RepID=UPI003B5B0938